MRKLSLALVSFDLLVIGTYITVNNNRRYPKKTLVLNLESKTIQDQLSNYVSRYTLDRCHDTSTGLKGYEHGHKECGTWITFVTENAYTQTITDTCKPVWGSVRLEHIILPLVPERRVSYVNGSCYVCCRFDRKINYHAKPTNFL